MDEEGRRSGGGEDEVFLNWNEGEGHMSVSQAMVGKLLSNRVIGKASVRNVVLKAWGVKGKLTVSDAGENLFLFSFEKKEEMDRARRDQPWTVQGYLLILKRWTSLLVMDEINFQECPFWIQFHGIPIEGMTCGNILRLGSKVGRVLAYEDPWDKGGISRCFIRVRVAIQVNKSVVEGFWVPRPGLPRIWVSVKYEKMQQICYSCGKFGHDNRVCDVEQVWSMRDQSRPRFGAWMGTVPLRPVGKVVYIEDGEAEFQYSSLETTTREVEADKG